MKLSAFLQTRRAVDPREEVGRAEYVSWSASGLEGATRAVFAFEGRESYTCSDGRGGGGSGGRRVAGRKAFGGNGGGMSGRGRRVAAIIGNGGGISRRGRRVAAVGGNGGGMSGGGGRFAERAAPEERP